jgi:hypothetical protein
MSTNPQPPTEGEPVFAPNLSTGREQVGRANPEAGPVDSPNFYGTGTDDLRAGSGKIDAPGEGLPATDQPRGPASGPRDSQGGRVGSQGIPITDSRADPQATS